MAICNYEYYLYADWIEHSEANTDAYENELYSIINSYYDEYEREYIEHLIKDEPKEEEIMDLEQMFKNREEGKCPFCGNKVNEDEFRDELSLKEYNISGMCQSCQDTFFGVDDYE